MSQKQFNEIYCYVCDACHKIFAPKLKVGYFHRFCSVGCSSTHAEKVRQGFNCPICIDMTPAQEQLKSAAVSDKSKKPDDLFTLLADLKCYIHEECDLPLEEQKEIDKRIESFVSGDSNWLVMAGNLTYGFNCFGPFPNINKANEWSKTQKEPTETILCYRPK